MAILFPTVVFGPVKSRRFGNSLGVNLLPLDNKLCNFNCIYCECGWTDLKAKQIRYTGKADLLTEIENAFMNLSGSSETIDCITFAGNGEPTMHPEFPEIMDGVVLLRDRYLKGKKINVLSNAALLGNKDVFNALMKADERILKLDAGTQDLFTKINGPLSHKNLGWYVNKLTEFKGDLSVQSLFLKGTYNQEIINNSEGDNLKAWLDCLKVIQPKQVMIYTLDRETPAEHLDKIPAVKLFEIAAQVESLGISARVYE